LFANRDKTVSFSYYKQMGRCVIERYGFLLENLQFFSNSMNFKLFLAIFRAGPQGIKQVVSIATLQLKANGDIVQRLLKVKQWFKSHPSVAKRLHIDFELPGGRGNHHYFCYFIHRYVVTFINIDVPGIGLQRPLSISLSLPKM
jgi:hypothetical protein